MYSYWILIHNVQQLNTDWKLVPCFCTLCHTYSYGMIFQCNCTFYHNEFTECSFHVFVHFHNVQILNAHSISLHTLSLCSVPESSLTECIFSTTLFSFTMHSDWSLFQCTYYFYNECNAFEFVDILDYIFVYFVNFELILYNYLYGCISPITQLFRIIPEFIFFRPTDHTASKYWIGPIIIINSLNYFEII